MKKAVVLLVSLFFILAFSVLIYKSLDDTKNYMDENSYALNNTQVVLTIKNLKKEIGDILKERSEDIDEKLKEEDKYYAFPIQMENLNIQAKFKKYERVDINFLSDEIKRKELENLFFDKGLSDLDVLEKYYNQRFSTKEARLEKQAQLEDILEKFNKDTEFEYSKILEEELGFFDEEKLYELFVNVNFNNANAYAYYILDKEGKEKYFDISFK